MSQAVKLSEQIVADARISSRALKRSVAGQIEHWARIGKIVEENHDLTYEFIKDILLAQAQAATGDLEPYQFEENW